MASGGQESDMVTVLLKTGKGVIRTKMNSQLAAIVLDPNGDPNTKQLIKDAVIKQMDSEHVESKECNNNILSSSGSTCTNTLLNIQPEPGPSNCDWNVNTQAGPAPKQLNIQSGPSQTQVHIWREEEEKLLLELRLGEDNYFNSVKNHETLWNKITHEMNTQNVNVTKCQIINKWKTMKKKYKEVIDQNGKTGNSKTSWKYYDIFNDTYGNKAGTQASITYDSEGKQKLKINDKKEEENKKEGCKKKEKNSDTTKAGPSKRKSEIVTMSDRVEAQNDKLLSVLKRQHNQKMRKMDKFLQIFEKSVTERPNKPNADGE